MKAIHLWRQAPMIEHVLYPQRPEIEQILPESTLFIVCATRSGALRLSVYTQK